MWTLYYAIDDAEALDAVTVTLHGLGVDKNTYYVVSQNRGRYSQPLYPDLYKNADLNKSKSWFSGVIIGFLFALWILLMRPSSIEFNFISFCAFCFSCSLLGGWIGYSLGYDSSQDKISPFYDVLEGGSYLLVINVWQFHLLESLKNAMRLRHDSVILLAQDEITHPSNVMTQHW